MNMRIKTKSPFHVGTGNTYTIMEAYVSGENLYRVDLSSAIKSKEDMNKYIEYADEENFEKIGNILRKGKVRYSAMIGQNVKLVYKGNMKTIRETIKDSSKEVPYIPGSTLKGAIRTALILKCLKDSNWKFHALKDGEIKEYEIWNAMAQGIEELRIQPLGRDYNEDKGRHINYGKRFEDLIVCFSGLKKNRCDAKYDIFKFLQVGDFYPVSTPKIKVENVISKSGHKRRYTIAEVVKGEFAGKISLAPELKAIMENNKYPLLENKIKILGLSKSDLNNIGSAENKMIQHILSATSIFIRDIAKKSEENVPEGANLRFGFGIGTLYQGFWNYIVDNLSTSQAERILESFNYYYKKNQWATVNMYPKSRDMLENGQGLGWAEITVV